MAELKRTLGFGTILALAVGSIMGSTMFFGAAIGASHSGNASIISWVILSILSIYIGTCFGELSAMFPRAGGVYEFAKQTYGRFFSFIVAWIAWVVGNLTVPLLVVAAVKYLIPGHEFNLLRIMLCILIILFLNFIAFWGIEASGFVVVLFTFLSIGLIISIIVPGIPHISSENFFPFFSGGLTPVFVTIFFIAEAFFGWEAATFLAEETKNPKEVIPKALIWGTIIVALLAILLTVVSLGIIPWKELIAYDTPMSAVFAKIFGEANVRFLSIGIFLTLIGSAAGTVITMPRLVLALARDRLFLRHFEAIHPKRNTPYRAIIFQTIVSLVIFAMAFGNYNSLLNLLLPLGFVMYIFVLLAVPILRYKKPDIERAFKVPFGKIAPVAVALFIAGLISAWVINEPNAFNLLKLALSFVVVGFPLYFLIALYYDPKMITGVNDITAYLNLFLEKVTLPRGVIKEIMHLVGNIKGKIILEYGCSVGTLTMVLAKEAGADGKIYAVDISKNDLKITKRRVDALVWQSYEREHARVDVIHDVDQIHRLHPNINYADAVISVGMLGSIQNIKNVLHDLYSIMPDGGKICFVEYGDFFRIIPNVEWLGRNESIGRIFRNCGFSVRVIRRRGLFWNYIYVYGMKYGEDVPFI